jgi:undecaprenyl-diphosphatase
LTIIEALILGIIQGISEFLPISSSGHLVLLQRVFGIEEGALTFDIAVHFATLMPIFIIFRNDIIKIIKNPIKQKAILYIAGSIPIAIVGYLFSDQIESLFESGRFLGIAFLITAIVLYLSDRKKNRGKEIKDLSVIDSFIIGIFQSFAAVPGISRSGMTISGGLLVNMKKKPVIKFAFLLGTPAILGATLKDILDNGISGFSDIGIIPLITGMIAAGVLGFIAIKFMLNVFSRINIKYFVYYLTGLGLLILLDQLFFNTFFGKII